MKRLGVLLVLLFVSAFHGLAEAKETTFTPASFQRGSVAGLAIDLTISGCCESDQLGNTTESGFCSVHCLTLVPQVSYFGIPMKPVAASFQVIEPASLELDAILRPPIA